MNDEKPTRQEIEQPELPPSVRHMRDADWEEGYKKGLDDGQNGRMRYCRESRSEKYKAGYEAGYAEGKKKAERTLDQASER